MKRPFVFLVLLSIILNSASLGFDGNRKGFVLGGGLGFSPVVKWDGDRVGTSPTSFNKPAVSSPPDEFGETKGGAGAGIIIGYAWDDYNLLVYEVNLAGFESSVFHDDIAQGFSGISWLHYFGAKGETFFSNVGLGTYVFDVNQLGDFDPGFGVLLGAGYEFSSHFQVGGYLSFGETTITEYEFKHTTLSVLVSVVAF